MQNQIEKVRFHNTEILCVFMNGEPFVAIRPICEYIGLHADRALSTIKNDEILGPAHAIERVQVDGEQARNLLCLPIQHVHGWLFSLQVSKVKAEIRPLLIEFKKECFNVLFNHFFGKNKNIEENVKKRFEIINKIKELDLLINSSIRDKKELKRQLDLLDNKNFNQLNLLL